MGMIMWKHKWVTEKLEELDSRNDSIPLEQVNLIELHATWPSPSKLRPRAQEPSKKLKNMIKDQKIEK